MQANMLGDKCTQAFRLQIFLGLNLNWQYYIIFLHKKINLAT